MDSMTRYLKEARNTLEARRLDSVSDESVRAACLHLAGAVVEELGNHFQYEGSTLKYRVSFGALAVNPRFRSVSFMPLSELSLDELNFFILDAERWERDGSRSGGIEPTSHLR